MHRASNGHCRVPTDFSGYTDTMAVWHIVVAELKPFGAKIGLEFILESFCLDRVEAAKKVRNIDTACYTYIHLSLVAYQRRGQVSCKWTIKCEGLSRIDRGAGESTSLDSYPLLSVKWHGQFGAEERQCKR